MRKLLALAGVSVVGLIAPATVGAASEKYEGAFESGGQLQFKLKKTNNGKQIIDFTFANFPITCDTGPNTTSGNLTFAVKVKDNKFDTVAIVGNPNNPKARLDLTGKLKSGGLAKGTMKVEGSKVAVDTPPDERHPCSSPKTDWIAGTD